MNRSHRLVSRFRSALAACAVAALATALPAAAESWLHVRVHDEAAEERVTVNLPVSMLSAAAAFFPDDSRGTARVSIDGVDWEWAELVDFWDAVKRAPEATFVTVESRDETIDVRRAGDWVEVRTRERGRDGAEVDAKIPLAVIDALLSGAEGELDFRAALEELAAHGPGNLMSIADGDGTVEVWIDDREEATRPGRR